MPAFILAGPTNDSPTAGWIFQIDLSNLFTSRLREEPVIDPAS
jgi:hypothetical protein